MPLTRDIVETYRRPRAVMRRHLDLGPREDRALIYLMLACGLIFIAQWPRLSREAHLNSEVPLEALLGGALLGWMFLAPLALYVIAGLAHAVGRMIGRASNAYAQRLALFWSLLAATPFWLLNGLAAGFLGPGAALRLTGAVAFLVFLVIWVQSMIEAGQSGAGE